MTDQNIVHIEQLVPVFNAKIGDAVTQACDARALHTYLQNGDEFAHWIKARITKYEFQENQDFICVWENTQTQRQDGQKGISKRTDYHLTIVMAKELAMVENNAKGREVRRYFIRMEKLVLEAATIQYVTVPKDYQITLQAIADIAQTLADTARTLAHDCELKNVTNLQSSASPAQPTPAPQKLLPPREAAFIQGWWDCLGTQSVTASDLYRAVTAKQCQILNDASSALLGDVAQWTPKKLSYALRRWSQLELDDFAIFNIGKTSHGLLWRLERKIE